MVTARREFIEGACYHVYNRSANKVEIFHNSSDYDYFLERIDHFANVTGIEVLAYAVLPNHYHFLLRETSFKREIFQGSCEYAISQFISRLENSYAKHYNLKTGHSGSVFQGPFCSRQIYDEYEYDVLLSYVLKNPIKHKIVDKLNAWDYIYSNPSGWDNPSGWKNKA